MEDRTRLKLGEDVLTEPVIVPDAPPRPTQDFTEFTYPPPYTVSRFDNGSTIPVQVVTAQPAPKTDSQKKYKRIQNRRLKARSEVADSVLRVAAESPSLCTICLLALRLVFTIGALVVFSIMTGRNGTGSNSSKSHALSLTGLAFLAVGALLIMPDIIYIIMLLNRDAKSSQYHGGLRTRQSPYMFYIVMSISTLLSLGMLAIAIASSILASRGTGDMSARSLGYISVTATLHIAVNCLTIGALLIDWIWTNNVILVETLLDQAMEDESMHLSTLEQP